MKGDPIVVMPECLTLICNYKHTGNQYVCIEEEMVCRGNLPVPEGVFGRLSWKIHADPSQKNLNSILDHIYGYKKIYYFTVVENWFLDNPNIFIWANKTESSSILLTYLP